MSRLLIADGDPMVLEVLRRLLAKPGREVAAAGNAPQALELAAKLLPEVALIDKNLPGASGLDLPRSLKELQPEMEIIVTAGYASLETAIEAVRMGAFDYLTKPIEDYGVFASRVQSAVDRATLRRSQRLLLERLMESELRHRRLIEAMPDALIVHDAQTARIVDANAAAMRLYGYSMQDLVRLSVHDLGGLDAGRQTHRRQNGAEFEVETSSTEYTENGHLLRVTSVRPAASESPCSSCRKPP